MRLVAPRIVNDVSNATDINHESHFASQAQYLVILEQPKDSAHKNLGLGIAVVGHPVHIL